MLTRIELVGGARWVDLVSPTSVEEASVEKALDIDVPTQEDIKKNEPSSRHYRKDGATFMAAQIVVNGETPLPQTSSVAFILKQDTLITVRYEKSRAFDLCASEIQRTESKPTSTSALVGLIEALVDRTSELLEGAASATDDMALSSLSAGEQPSKRRTVTELEAVLAEIQRLHRRVAKTRESLVSLGRMTGYLLTNSGFSDLDTRDRAQSVSRDIISVTDHATFVAQNIQFVLDTMLGVISVEQNAIVKSFSIVAVVLLPPTLIAAIYGMNFETMPELTWSWGYPAALAGMISSAVLPYLWCRKRGWL